MLALLALLLVSQSFWPIHVSKNISASFAISYTYDSNPFLYSDGQIKEFLDGSTSKKFMNVKTIDDLTVKTDLRINFLIGDRTLAVEHRLRHFLRNRRKDYQIIGLKFRFNDRMTLRFKHIPDFYIRAYRDRDEDGSPYKEFTYQLNSFSIRLRPNEFLATNLKLSFYDYPVGFNEYDSKDFELAVLLNFTNFKTGYVFDLSKAKGVEDRWIADPSFVEHTVLSEAKLTKGSSTYRFEMSLSRRIFLSRKDAQLDPLHVGRKDWIMKSSLEMQRRLNKRVTLITQVSYSLRNVQSDFKDDIDEVKDYKRLKISIGFRFRL